MQRHEGGYYIRLTVHDRPGVAELEAVTAQAPELVNPHVDLGLAYARTGRLAAPTATVGAATPSAPLWAALATPATGGPAVPHTEDVADAIYRQILGFGEYGFPESHSASFALLVYVSSWIKCHHPAAFCAALLNSQPMGFYAPAQLVRDARAGNFEGGEIPVDLQRQWIQGTGPATRPRAIWPARWSRRMSSSAASTATSLREAGERNR